MVNTDNNFFSLSIDEIKKGYTEDKEYICCVICGKKFTKGKIYKINDDFYDAEKSAKLHINDKHNSMLDYLLNMNSTFTGISEVQKSVIELIAKGLSDKQIAERLGVANSTIRNHRYKLREREKQAKLFLAMMDLLSTSIITSSIGSIFLTSIPISVLSSNSTIPL